MFPRHTLRCLREDLKRSVPSPIDFCLNEIDNEPILAYARRYLSNGFEVIRAIDDNVLYKCKPNRELRGAAYKDVDENYWIVATGKREQGSINDFYKALEIKAKNNLKQGRKSNSFYKKNYSSDSDFLLPQQEDFDRLKIERLYLSEKHERASIFEAFNEAKLKKNKEINFVYSGTQAVITILDSGDSSYWVELVIKNNPLKNISDIGNYISSILKNYFDPKEMGYSDSSQSGFYSSKNGDIILFGLMPL